MKITIDKNSGFCWGVVRTIFMAERELDKTQNLYCLGEIIHNPEEIHRLEVKGLKTVYRDDFPKIPNSTVLIRAHGEPPETYRQADKYGITLIDATCPVVTKVQERIRNYDDQNYQIVIFGKKNHAEVVGLLGQVKGRGLVISSLEEVASVDVSKKTVLFSQTTMDKTAFSRIRDKLKKRVNELIVDSFENEAIQFITKDTICGQVSGREMKLREFAKQNNVILFVAGKTSSNGKVLFNICKEVNTNSYFIENENELMYEWLDDAESVGITGATSTPHWLMERVKLFIKEKFKKSSLINI
ncbi:MAG: 4-hydroxy-3-methylbut-2-enyl diphosphate reductase [Bacteroidetes bacterium]|nr:4-hydroxy-3-methylbut-2-enyl diphosphate reductase [Bacteroidota bacterium]